MPFVVCITQLCWVLDENVCIGYTDEFRQASDAVTNLGDGCFRGSSLYEDEKAHQWYTRQSSGERWRHGCWVASPNGPWLMNSDLATSDCSRDRRKICRKAKTINRPEVAAGLSHLDSQHCVIPAKAGSRAYGFPTASDLQARIVSNWLHSLAFLVAGFLPSPELRFVRFPMR